MGMEMTPRRWENTCAYLREVFGDEDQHLHTLMHRAVAAGLPDIAVSADVGRLLKLLTSMTPAIRALEVGTLAGYSGIWIARGLTPGGRLITIESEAKHADFALRAFQEASVADRVEVRRGKALDALPALATEFGGRPSFDLVFFDAVKAEYPEYFQIVRPLIKVGGLLVADNVLGAGWWIDDPAGSNPDRDGADRLNRTVADDPDFEAVAVPIREGVLIAKRMRDPGPGQVEL